MEKNCNKFKESTTKSCNECNPCEGVCCCTEIYKTECVKHNGQVLNKIINDILISIDSLKSFETNQFNTQSIGGVSSEDLTSTLERLIAAISVLANKTYDLSGITVSGNPGPSLATSDQAINFLIQKIEQDL